MEKFQYSMTDRANIGNDVASDTQSRTSKGSYLKRSNNNTGSQSYHRILSRSRRKNTQSKEFDSTYIKVDKSFTVQPQNIRKIVRILSKLVQRRQTDSLNKIALNLEQSTSFSFDGNGIHWSRIQDELGIQQKQKAKLLSKKINLEQSINHNRSKDFFKKFGDNILIKTPKIPKIKQRKTQKNKKVRVLQNIQNFQPQIQLATPKNCNSIKQQLNLVKKTLKNTKKLIELETKQTNKKRAQLTDRVTTQHHNNGYQSNLSTSRNKTAQNNYSYHFSNTPGTYTPLGGSTTRSYVQSFWNDQIKENKNSKSRLTQRNEEVVVHHVIQPIIHHVYHPTTYQTSSFQIVNQARLQPVLIPRRGSINQALGRYVSQTPISYQQLGSFSSHNIHQRPIGSFFPQSPQYQKPHYY